MPSKLILNDWKRCLRNLLLQLALFTFLFPTALKTLVSFLQGTPHAEASNGLQCPAHTEASMGVHL